MRQERDQQPDAWGTGELLVDCFEQAHRLLTMVLIYTLQCDKRGRKVSSRSCAQECVGKD